MFKIDADNQSIGLYVKGLTAAQVAMLADGAHKALQMVLNERRMAEVDARLVADAHGRHVRKLEKRVAKLKRRLARVRAGVQDVHSNCRCVGVPTAEQLEPAPLFMVDDELLTVDDLIQHGLSLHDSSYIRMDENGRVYVYPYAPTLQGRTEWYGNPNEYLGDLVAGAQAIDWQTWGIDYDRTADPVRVTVLPLAAEGEEVENPF